MAIIYSYPKQTVLQNTDLLIGTRFSTEPGVVPRSISFSIETLTEYINASAPIPTLDQVLVSGDVSLQTAGIGELGLWDNPNAGYAIISVADSVLTFYDYIGNIVAYIGDSGIGLKRGSFTGVFATSVFTANRQYIMPDKSGTIALTSDIPAALLTANYGLAAQIDSSTNIVNTTSELTLISNEYEGTLSVPANSFAVGDSFKVSLMGHINCLSSATLHIRIKTSAGVLLADTGVIDLDAATAKHWKLDIEFTIRQIGGEGVASIVSGGSFSYNKNASNNPESITFISINNSDFDTTISNELAITAQWNNANSSNAIYSDIFTLNKVY